MGGVFIDPLSDAGFKMLFGQEGKSEIFLIDLLNELFIDDPFFGGIKEIRYKNTEGSRNIRMDKEVRYDLRCTTDKGHEFIVEMQRKSDRDLIPRNFYYFAKAMQGQFHSDKKRRPFKYQELLPVVTVMILEKWLPEARSIPILDYAMREKTDPQDVLNYERMIFVQLGHFHKKEKECEIRQDRWLYILKNMNLMEYMPFEEACDKVFEALEEYSKFTNMTAAQRDEYDALMKFSTDLYNKLENAREEGEEKGREAERIAMARNLKSLGVDVKTIAQASGFSEEEINSL